MSGIGFCTCPSSAVFSYLALASVVRLGLGIGCPASGFALSLVRAFRYFDFNALWGMRRRAFIFVPGVMIPLSRFIGFVGISVCMSWRPALEYPDLFKLHGFGSLYRAPCFWSSREYCIRSHGRMFRSSFLVWLALNSCFL